MNDFFEWVQHNRAIVNTRDEPLADPNQYRRIHLLCGDSNMAEYATALKMGTTGLVLQRLRRGRPRVDSGSVNRLRRCRRFPVTWSANGSCGWNRGSRSRHRCAGTVSLAARRHCQGQDEETIGCSINGESVLTGLRGGYEALVGRIDWASKLWLLDTYRDAEQVAG